MVLGGLRGQVGEEGVYGGAVSLTAQAGAGGGHHVALRVGLGLGGGLYGGGQGGGGGARGGAAAALVQAHRKGQHHAEHGDHGIQRQAAQQGRHHGQAPTPQLLYSGCQRCRITSG